MKTQPPRKRFLNRMLGNPHVAICLIVAAVLAWSFICAGTSQTGARIATVGLLLVIAAIGTAWALNMEGENDDQKQ
jgi:hypothetical protein